MLTRADLRRGCVRLFRPDFLGQHAHPGLLSAGALAGHALRGWAALILPSLLVAQLAGGALCVVGGNLRVQDSSVTNSRVTYGTWASGGGLIFAAGGTTDLILVVTRNTSAYSSGGLAIISLAAVVNAVDCEFLNSTALWAGFMFALLQPASFTGVNLTCVGMNSQVCAQSTPASRIV